MSVTELLEPVLTGGIQNPNFFNGRTLTAEDLRTLQQAIATRQQQLGQAVGDGVITGLEVSLSKAATLARPVVTIRKGLAINRRGDTLALPADIDLALVAETAARAAEAGEFAVCDQFAPVTLTNLGLYLLVVLPASGYEGRVPMTTVGMEEVAGSCGSKAAISGARFRLVRLAVAANPDPQSLAARVTQLATELEVLIGQLPAPDKPQPPDPARLVFQKISLLQNGVAHLCFGTEALTGFAADPLGRDAGGASPLSGYGLVDELRAGGALTDCEVPLSLVYWTSQGLKFVDQWAVRRMATAVSASATWPGITSGRRRAEGVAMVLQFQEQLERQIPVAAGFGVAPQATRYFWYLPPIGVLPVVGVGPSTGVNHVAFFQTRTVRGPLYVEGSKFFPLVFTALGYPAIDLAHQEMHWLYLLRENTIAVESGSVTQPVVLFTSGFVPNHGYAQFDLAYWSYASYA